MDAPPPKEDCRPFVHVARLLARAGVHAPGRARRGSAARVPAALGSRRAHLPRRTRRELRARTLLGRDRRADPLADAPRATASFRPTTRRCSRASSSSFRTGTWRDTSAVSSRPRRPRRCARHSGRSSTTISRSRGLRPSRLPLAQPDGHGAEPGRPRFPGCGLRPRHLRSRLAAARRVRRVGRGAADRLGGALLGARARGEAAGRRRLRRVLARLRVDGRAAPAEGARHLRAARVPRRQARLPGRHAARDGLSARCLRALRRAPSAARRSWTSSRAARRPSATRFRGPHDVRRNDPRGGPRRADAPAVRHDAEAAARRGRQAADRVADRGARARGLSPRS